MRNKFLSLVLCHAILALGFPIPGFCINEKLPKIGVIAPLTGAYASFGVQIKDGMQLAAGNEARLIFEDSQFDTKTALSAYRKLTSIDKVDYLISAGGETCGVLNRQAQKDHLVHIALGCNTEEFSSPDSFSFRLDVNEAIAAEKLAKYLRHLQVERIGMINIQNTWGTTVAKFAAQAFRTHSIKITDEITFLPKDAGDLRTSLKKLLAGTPQRIFVVASPETFAAVLKQLAELHVQMPVASTISVENPQFIELSGPLSDGIIYLSVKNNPITKQEHPDFFARFPTNSTFTAWGYDAVLLLKTASRYPNSKSYLQNLRNFVGAYNVYNFDQSGELHFEYEMRTIKDGRYEFLDSVS